MSTTAQQVINAINEYVARFTYSKKDWYIGIASNPDDRLFVDHNVDKKNGYWIHVPTDSHLIARAAEKALLAVGFDGGASGGDDSTTFVYAYARLRGTVR